MKKEGKSNRANSGKLLVLCQLFYPELISTGQTLTELCEQLVEMGVDIDVLCGPPTIVDRDSHLLRDLEYRGMQIKRAWGTRFLKLNIVGRVINQITFSLSVFLYLLRDSSRCPILVLTNPPFLAVICVFFRTLKARRYIYLIFDVYPDTAVKLGLLKEKGVVARLWNLFNAFTYKYASKIIVIGRCMQEMVAKKVGQKYFDKIHVIHVWSDDKLIQSVENKENPFIKMWHLEGKFVASYSGNMGRFHDMETIMEGARQLKDNKDIVFLFIGEGHKKAWMMEFADKWRLTNCQFHPYVDREDLGFSLSCGDIGLVSLSKGQEGLSVPSKAFGLMAAGMPVIAVMSSRSEIARIIMGENCGVVIEPGDTDKFVSSILRLYNDHKKSKLMGRNARRAIDLKYNLHAAARSYFELICSMNT